MTTTEHAAQPIAIGDHRTTTVLAHVIPSAPRSNVEALYVDVGGAPRRISYGTYFNAFPAAYWAHWTQLTDVTLRLTLSGRGRVEVLRTDRTSTSSVVHAVEVDSECESIDVTVSLVGLERGGWVWFDLLPAEQSTRLEVMEGSWTTTAAPRTAATASIGITTFNKPDYCVRTLAALAASPSVRAVVDTIYLVDQGTMQVSDAAGFAAAATDLDGQLRVIEQRNLGGSGGFSRAMLETLDAGRSAFTLLLDDDVEIEPEAIYRLVQFGRFTTTPTVVGGHMLDMLKPTVLHAWAEEIDPRWFLWRPGPPAHVRHDFADRNLRATSWTHRRDDADYTGWWMCLIPTETMREVGLSLPAFIKWDDAEYSLRAKTVGTSTVSLPGSALWHVAWVDKDDSREWQAYFHARNRLVAALVHSTERRGGMLLTNLRRVDLRHLLCMEYYAAHIRERAYRDVLRGPEHMHAEIGGILAELRSLRTRFTESTEYPTPQQIPDSRHGRQSYDIEMHYPPSRHGLYGWTSKQLARHWLVPSPPADAQPDVELARRDATWWRLPTFDSVVVTDSPRTSAVVYRRDRAFFRDQLRRSRESVGRLERSWDELAVQYRAAIGDITSPAAWRTTLLG